MTFKPTALPTLSRSSYPTSTGSVMDMQKAKKAINGLAAAQILKRKYGGIIRSKNPNQEPWTAEKLLLVSAWGASDMLDLTPNIVNYKRVLTLDDCKRFEPGTVRYYICMLPGSDSVRRPLGDTPIACQHLADGKAYDSLEEALAEWGEDEE